MKIAYGTLIYGIAMSACASAGADGDNMMNIPQISGRAQETGTVKEEDTAVPIRNDQAAILQTDHQTAILNDPTISDYGRAAAIISNNTATNDPGASAAAISQDANALGADERQLDDGSAAKAARNYKQPRSGKTEAGAVYAKQQVLDTSINAGAGSGSAAINAGSEMRIEQATGR